MRTDHEVDSTVSGSGTGRPAPAAASTTAGSSRCSTSSTRAASSSGVSPGSTGTRAWARIAPAIVLLVHQVHGGAALARAARQHGLVHAAAVHAAPAERGQQGRVHVDDAAAIAGDDRGRHQLEVAGQHEQVHPVMRRAGRATRRHRPGRPGPRQGRRALGPARAPPASGRLLSTSTTRAGRPARQGAAAAPRGCCRAPRRPPPRASSWPGKVNARRRAGKYAPDDPAAQAAGVEDRPMRRTACRLVITRKPSANSTRMDPIRRLRTSTRQS